MGLKTFLERVNLKFSFSTLSLTSEGREYLKQEYGLSGSEIETLVAEASAAQDPPRYSLHYMQQS